MINLKNLIDFLPTYFKDTDTYKVDNKGVLEKFLEISGEYLEDNITPDIENALEYIDINHTPTECLNYLWEFLGQLPFAYGNSIDQEKFKAYYNGLLPREDNIKLSKHWIRPKKSPIILNESEVRRVLKYSVALLKIRGTKKFFEVLFRLYDIIGTILDPTEGKNPDLWLKTITTFDTNLKFDTRATRDNLYSCSQCVLVEVNIITYKGNDPNLLPNFPQFRKAIENIFDRFLPYNSRAIIKYAGIIPNDNVNIKVEYEDPNITKLETSKIFEVGLKITITSSWPDTDKRYQVSGDGKIWGSTKHEAYESFYATKAGTYYFRSVADPSKVTSIMVEQLTDELIYVLTLSTYESELKPGIDHVTNTITAYKIHNGIKSFCKVRVTNTNTTYDTPKELSINKPGTYKFEVVEFPSKFVIWEITKIPVIYTVTCEPTVGVLVNGPDGIPKAGTIITAIDNYNTKGLTITNMANGEILDSYVMSNYCDYQDKLGVNYVDKNGVVLYGKSEKDNRVNFIAYAPGKYSFRCTQDNNENPATAVFSVKNVGEETYRISVSPDNSIISTNGQKVSTLVKCSLLNEIANADFRVRCQETGQIFNAGGQGYIFTTTTPGTYTFEGVNFVANIVRWVVEKDTTTSSLTRLSIQPENPKDPNWVTLWESEYVNNATYALKPLTECKAKLVLWKNGSPIPDRVEILEDIPDSYYTNIYYTGTIYSFKAGVHKLYLNSDPNVQATLEVLPYIPTMNIYCNPELVNMAQGDTATTTITCSSSTSNVNTRIRQRGRSEEFESPYNFTTKEAGTYIFEAVADTNVTCKFTVNILGESTSNIVLQPNYHEVTSGATSVSTEISGEGAVNPYEMVANSKADWIKSQIYASRTRVTVKMGISENTTGKPRIGTVEVTNGREISVITISQS